MEAQEEFKARRACLSRVSHMLDTEVLGKSWEMNGNDWQLQAFLPFLACFFDAKGLSAAREGGLGSLDRGQGGSNVLLLPHLHPILGEISSLSPRHEQLPMF